MTENEEKIISEILKKLKRVYKSLKSVNLKQLILLLEELLKKRKNNDETGGLEKKIHLLIHELNVSELKILCEILESEREDLEQKNDYNEKLEEIQKQVEIRCMNLSRNEFFEKNNKSTNTINILDESLCRFSQNKTNEIEF